MKETPKCVRKLSREQRLAAGGGGGASGGGDGVRTGTKYEVTAVYRGDLTTT